MSGRRYGLLILPAANRVYAEATPRLARAELQLFGARVLRAGFTGTGEERIGGVPYVTFETEGELDARDVAYLSNLSTAYALFELEGDGQLRPVELTPLDTLPDDLITIPKYSGKTNEHFTKLLLNITLLASDFAEAMLDRRLHVLDPLCGRGTTLNQALMYGYDATGIDHDEKDFEAYAAFLKTWLRRKRLKHRAEITPVRRNRRRIGRQLHVEVGLPDGPPAVAGSPPSPAEVPAADPPKSGADQGAGSEKPAKRPSRSRVVTMVHADTLQAREIFRREAFDLLVTDLPYGVQHGSRGPRPGGSGPGAGLSRKPLELLRAALPQWIELLRPGGAMGLAWNTHVADRTDAEAVLARAGLEVCDAPAYLAFRHRVDASIERDVLVARRP